MHFPFPWLKMSDFLKEIICSVETITTWRLCVNLIFMCKSTLWHLRRLFMLCSEDIFASITLAEFLRGNKTTTPNTLSFILWSVGSSHIYKCAARETSDIFLIYSSTILRSQLGCFDDSVSRESAVTSALRSSWQWLLCFAIFGLSACNSSQIFLFIQVIGLCVRRSEKKFSTLLTSLTFTAKLKSFRCPKLQCSLQWNDSLANGKHG